MASCHPYPTNQWQFEKEFFLKLVIVTIHDNIMCHTKSPRRSFVQKEFATDWYAQSGWCVCSHNVLRQMGENQIC